MGTRLTRFDLATGKMKTVAVFTLEGGKVSTRWYEESPGTRRSIARISFGDQVSTPDDGGAYLVALERHFGQSSRYELSPT